MARLERMVQRCEAGWGRFRLAFAAGAGRRTKMTAMPARTGSLPAPIRPGEEPRTPLASPPPEGTRAGSASQSTAFRRARGTARPRPGLASSVRIPHRRAARRTSRPRCRAGRSRRNAHTRCRARTPWEGTEKAIRFRIRRARFSAERSAGPPNPPTALAPAREDGGVGSSTRPLPEVPSGVRSSRRHPGSGARARPGRPGRHDRR